MAEKDNVDRPWANTGGRRQPHPPIPIALIKRKA